MEDGGKIRVTALIQNIFFVVDLRSLISFPALHKMDKDFKYKKPPLK